MTKHKQPEQRTKGDERREDLIAVAYQIIAEKGFEGLRVRDVAAQAGVNIATLHYYFNTKEDLVKGVVDHLLHLFISIEAPQTPEDSTPAPVRQLRQIMADLQYQLETAPEMFVVLTELHLRSQRDPAVQTILSALDNGWRSHITALYQEGLNQNLFNLGLSPNTVASLLIALIKGMSIQAISQLDQYDFDQISSTINQWLIKPS
jgi:AcrR family transcriptional regulator